MLNENVTLRDVQIFDAGTHNGIPFDEAAVKDLFESTREVMEQVKPYLGWANVEAPHLGIGHRNKDGTPNIGDELAEKKKRSDLPSLGWMANLRMKGTKILTDFVDVPRSVAEAIRLGRYRRVSPDIEFNYKNPVTGKRLAAVIKAVRLIGVTPAIKTLDDVLALGDESCTLSLTEAGGNLEGITVEEENVMPKPFENVEIKSAEDALGFLVDLFKVTPAAVKVQLGWDKVEKEMLEGPEKKEAEPAPKPGEKKPADEPADSPDVAALRAEIADRDKKIEELEGATAQLQSTVGGITKEKLDTERKAAVDRLKNEGRLAPAEEPVALALMEQLPEGKVVEFSEGGKMLKLGGLELVEKLFRMRPKVAEFGERGRGGVNEEGSTPEAMYEEGKSVYSALGITPQTFADFGPVGRRIVGGVAQFAEGSEDQETLEAAKALVTLLRKAGR